MVTRRVALDMLVAAYWDLMGVPQDIRDRGSDCLLLSNPVFHGDNDFEDYMHNFFEQDIVKGDFIVQVARTATGVVRRLGVVLGIVEVKVKLKEPIKHGIGGPQWHVMERHLRVAWYDVEAPASVVESAVAVDYIVKVDPDTLPSIVTQPLRFASMRGRAKV